MKDIPMIDPVTELKRLFDAKKFDEAIEFCQKLLEKDPNNPIALQNLSTLYYIVGAYEDSIKCSEKILEKDLNEEHAIKNKMLALEKLGQHDEVLKCCEILLEKNDKDVDALMNMAVTLNYLERYQEAIPYYDTVQQIMPDFSRAAVEKSEAFKALGKEDDAFLAAQGIRLDEAELLKIDAKENKYSVQHAFLLKRYKKTQEK